MLGSESDTSFDVRYVMLGFSFLKGLKQPVVIKGGIGWVEVGSAVIDCVAADDYGVGQG